MGFVQTGAGGIGSGDQTVEGIKTFEQLPLLVDLPIADEQAANKLYVDTVAGALSTVNKRVGSWVAGTDVTVTHNLGTTDVMVSIYDQTTGDVIMCAAQIVDTNNVQLSSSEAPPAGGWRVVIIG